VSVYLDQLINATDTVLSASPIRRKKWNPLIAISGIINNQMGGFNDDIPQQISNYEVQGMWHWMTPRKSVDLGQLL